MSFVSYALMVYAYLVFDDIAFTILLLSGLAIAASVGLYVLSFINESEECGNAEEIEEKYNTKRKKIFGVGSKVFFPIFVVGILLQSMYPEKEDLTYIIGGATALTSAQYVAGSEEAKQLPDNVLKAANKFLEDSEKQ